MKYSFPRQNGEKEQSFSFIKEPLHYLSTDISKFSQIHPKPNVIRVSSQIPTIKIHYLETSSKKPKIENHHYKPQSQCLCCSQTSSKRPSLNFLDEAEQHDGCCKLSKTKHETSFISKVSRRQQQNSDDFFDSEIFTKILIKGQISTQQNLQSSLCPNSPCNIAQTSIMSQISSKNSGIKLGLRIIANKIENLKKKRATFKLIRHLKIIQFVFKLNYIIKVKSFFNLEFSIRAIKESEKLIVLKDKVEKILYFCLKQQRFLKAKGFLRLKMFKKGQKASLIQFAIIFKKIIKKRMLNTMRQSFEQIKLTNKY